MILGKKTFPNKMHLENSSYPVILASLKLYGFFNPGNYLNFFFFTQFWYSVVIIQTQKQGTLRATVRLSNLKNFSAQSIFSLFFFFFFLS